METMAGHVWRSYRRNLRAQPGRDQLVMGAHPAKAYGAGGRTVEKRGDLLDHMCVIYDYPDNVQATFIGSQITPRFYRSNHERYIGENGFIETAREYWTYSTGTAPVTEKSGQDITIDSLQAFVRRVT